MKSIYVYGASGHGLVVSDIAKACGYTNIMFVDDGDNVWPTFDSIKSYSDVPMVFGVGDNRVRARLFEKAKYNHFNLISLIHPSVIVSDNVSIGSASVIMPNVVMNSKSIIGHGVILNTGCILEHENSVDNFVHISPNVALAGNVCVGAFTHIGIGASVIQGIVIGTHSVIGAGSVVVKNIDSYKKAYGNPCREVEDILRDE